MTNTKRKIDGEWFDTETAELIAEHWMTAISRWNLDYLREGLYRQHGRLFLAGEAVKRMKYAKGIDQFVKNDEAGGKIGGLGIALVTKDEAVEWIQRLPENEQAKARMNLDGFLIV